MSENESGINAYLALMKRERLWSSAGNLKFMLDCFFAGVPLQGRDVLDVGAGVGLATFYAGAHGASRVVGLEPEAAGAMSGVVTTFMRCRDTLDLPGVTLRAETFQQFDPGHERFDVITLYNTINYLDEPACIVLQESQAARDIYIEQFRRMYAMLRPGGHLLVADCSRHNFFGKLGIRNPVVPSIEWHKHQSPRFWAGLLYQIGFRELKISWSSLNTLRQPGRVLLGNAAAATSCRVTSAS